MNKLKKHRKYKLAILLPHPIHYLLGITRELERHPNVEVVTYFCSDFGIRRALDTTFGKVVKWYSKDILKGISYKFIKNYSLSSSTGGFFSIFNPGIMPELRKGNYDAVMVHGYAKATNWLLFLMREFIRTPILLRGETPLHQDFRRSKIKRMIKKIILGKFLFKRMAALLYIGKENRKFYKYYGVPDEKLFFVPYCVDNDNLISEYKKMKDKKSALKKKLGINPDKVAILFLGKFIKKKRPMDLLRAYEKIKMDNKALIFVADGPLRESLESYTKQNNLQNVYFVGFKHQEKLPNYYSIADIFVLPSETGETWGVVVNEAMCFGLPIVVSDMVGSGFDLVREGENGFRFPLGDINTLTHRIEDLIDNPSKRNAFGKKSLEIIQEYSYKKDVEGIISALHYINKT